MSCINVLKEKGFRLTPQRRLILEYIHDNTSHLTADEIIKFVGIRMPGVNKSTVYRTLDLLEKSGSVLKSEIGNHFIYHHAEDGHHHHLVCRSCGNSMRCYEDIFSQVKNILVEQYGFQADFKHIMVSGLCEECRSKNQE
jgi:Fur family ferric uptake transcriptional regulator